jgi:hypothetical protein
MNDNAHLLAALRTAVGLRLLDLAGESDYERARFVARAPYLAQAIAAHGDELQFGGRHCAKTFAALADGLAALALAPGGVTFAGAHWCTGHQACLDAANKAAPVPSSPETSKPARPITTIKGF